MQRDLFGNEPDPAERVPDWTSARYPEAGQLDVEAVRDLFLSLLQRNDRLLCAIEEHVSAATDREHLAAFEELDQALCVRYGDMFIEPPPESAVYALLETAMAFDAKLEDARRELLAGLSHDQLETVTTSAQRRKAKQVHVHRRAVELAMERRDESDFEVVFEVTST